MTVASAHTVTGRLSETLAVERNDVAALLAARVIIAHAELGGTLDAAQSKWRDTGRVVTLLGECD
jgi:hypothetical protein